MAPVGTALPERDRYIANEDHTVSAVLDTHQLFCEYLEEPITSCHMYVCGAGGQGDLGREASRTQP